MKLGYEAIEYAIRKWMTKNTKGIASIPGQKMKDKIKILVDKYADQFRIKGQDVNTVTVKQVDNAIDYGMTLKKQQTKKLEAAAAKKQAEYDYITSEKGIKAQMDKLLSKSPEELKAMLNKQSNVIKGDFNPKEEWWKPKKASGGIAGQLHLNRPGYAGGKSTFPKQLSLFARPKIGDALKKLSDAELKEQMKALARKWGVPMPKASGGLAHVLGV